MDDRRMDGLLLLLLLLLLVRHGKVVLIEYEKVQKYCNDRHKDDQTKNRFEPQCEAVNDGRRCRQIADVR